MIRYVLTKDARCAHCDESVEAFRDDLSRDEYAISGTCQACQDEVFDSGDQPEPAERCDADDDAPAF